MSESLPSGTRGQVRQKHLSFIEQSSAFLQYLYFLRFSLIFWLSLPLLALVDSVTGMSALTRGLFTPSIPSAVGAADFFTICLGMVCLLTARITCIEGADRFLTLPPNWMRKALGDQSKDWAWRTLLIAQLPGLYVMYRYHVNAHLEGVIADRPAAAYELAWSAIGIVGAILFWRFVNDLYYWASFLRRHAVSAPTLLWPSPKKTTEQAVVTGRWPWTLQPLHWLFTVVARCGPGYQDKTGQLLGTHQLAIVGSLCYLCLYLLFAPLTAPLEHVYLTRAVFGFLAVGAALVALSLTKSEVNTKTRRSVLLSFSLMTFLAILALTVSYSSRHAALWLPDFPVISAIAVLLTVLTFAFCGLSFYADRHRIPVLTSALIFITALQFVSHEFVSGEHYFEPVLRTSAAPPITPADAYENYRKRVCKDQPSCPIIIVTATGGGIQAAAWTQSVLSQLEMDLARDCVNRHFTFHDHVLLLSTVSGGSVGALPFLREYYAAKPFDRSQVIIPDHDTPETVDSDPCNYEAAKEAAKGEPVWSGQGRRAAFCSSLGGVGWGLQYVDLLRLIAPYVPYQSKLTDRSQALEQTLTRNLTSESCDTTFGPDSPGNAPVARLTLANMMADLGAITDRQHPAFSFNTTVAETGGRFLLSNYENDPRGGTEYGIPPAASWLDAYDQSNTSPLDMNLVTAARLSATFPYISSAARVRHAGLPYAHHFIDGGYFDNDGTATAIEFLQQIFPPKQNAGTFSGHTMRVLAKTADSSMAASRTLPDEILFIEIRDGADLSEDLSDERLALASPSSKSWNPGSQLSAPLLGFWRAGHSSVTRRNRRELQLLMQDLESRRVAHFHHIVFDYQKPAKRDENESQSHAEARSPDRFDPSRHEAADPLSWHLTPSQKTDIATSLNILSFCVARVETWSENPSAHSNEFLRHDGRVECNHDISVKQDPLAAALMAKTPLPARQ